LAWTVEFSKSADKSLKKLPLNIQTRLVAFLRQRVLSLPDPRSIGQALQGGLAGKWRYRVGDYRIICAIEDQKMVILVIELGHRSDIYE
jgi:mRNA interferase RelE/StbE